MKKERNAFKAGLFILVTIVLIVVVVVSINGAGRFVEPQQKRVALFPLDADIGGMRVGDEVRLGGLKVGTIESIEPAGLGTKDAGLVVTFSLPERYKFYAGAEVGVQTGLTGASVLNVRTLGTPDKGDLPAGAPLAGQPDPKTAFFARLGGASADVQAIVTDVQAMVADFRLKTYPKVNETVVVYKETGEAAKKLVEHVDSKVDPAVDKYNTVAAKTGDMMDSVRDMIGPSAKDWKGTIADLHEITTNLKTELPKMLDKVQGSIDNAKAALQDVQQAAANTKDISADVRQVLGGNKGKLEGIIASMKTTSDNLKNTSAEVRRNPWRLLYTPKADEMNNVNLYDSARQFAEGANDLNDAAQALRDVLKTRGGEAKKEEIDKLVDRLKTSADNFHNVEDKLWQKVKE